MEPQKLQLPFRAKNHQQPSQTHPRLPITPTKLTAPLPQSQLKNFGYQIKSQHSTKLRGILL